MTKRNNYTDVSRLPWGWDGPVPTGSVMDAVKNGSLQRSADALESIAESLERITRLLDPDARAEKKATAARRAYCEKYEGESEAASKTLRATMPPTLEKAEALAWKRCTDSWAIIHTARELNPQANAEWFASLTIEIWAKVVRSGAASTRIIYPNKTIPRFLSAYDSMKSTGAPQ